MDSKLVEMVIKLKELESGDYKDEEKPIIYAEIVGLEKEILNYLKENI